MPRLLINRDLVGPFAWRPRSRDVVQLGDMVHSVERLVELLGWTEELRDLMRQEAEKVRTVRGSSPGLPSSLLGGLGPPGVEPCLAKTELANTGCSSRTGRCPGPPPRGHEEGMLDAFSPLAEL